ncbi:hypothetical protein TTHERM_00535210 (macronuclear) [Tetrahymena thermophila SB210]|uniref:Uncharacterized protein n=1 Tax=Tetrahymena thermophila (strain SB210) TaxID=312017 RepID=I7MLW3_TETTS|nr:hypothetical protein TTHERM_00535210 [Tetrahymena thermophila SB210]EAS03185.1 hypothetical protein TTHERM_00535210 [Tetrahymena thermophila SB210]8G2Z_2F Chain 2F, CFAP182B [Tetrahymena thermophila CU428]8G3D_2F Chain 2F, CFAP182B [Tetrahymena thermophila]|eukprot:XP_001023430.1 hypothetical protein TTHERM_00535210 [Tetrahymena thermophila SB210]
MNYNNLTQEQVQEQIKKLEEEHQDFHKKHANTFFKTTYKTYGGEKQVIDVPKHFGHDGRFTDHLLHATMYRNHSLNTTCDKERWMKNSKDWMEHLN